MCCKHYHIICSTFPLNFKRRICVLKDVIPNFKNHILVTWPATNLLILRKSCGFEKPKSQSILLFKTWPTNRFSKAKSYNFHFHKNGVTWPLSANGLLEPSGQGFKILLQFLWKSISTCSSHSYQRGFPATRVWN